MKSWAGGNKICNLPTGRLQYSTQQVEATVEDLYGIFVQLQPGNQKQQRVGQKTAVEFPNYKGSRDGG